MHSHHQGRSQGRARQGPGPPKCCLGPANENLKKSKYSNRTFKYLIKAVKGPDCALPNVKLWLRHWPSPTAQYIVESHPGGVSILRTGRVQ